MLWHRVYDRRRKGEDMRKEGTPRRMPRSSERGGSHLDPVYQDRPLGDLGVSEDNREDACEESPKEGETK